MTGRRLPTLILASQSPRRRQILENMGLKFTVHLPEAEEEMPSVASSERVIVANAHAKAVSVASKREPEDIVLGADTLVLLDGEVMGKPKSPQDARAMISKLSGRTHEVITGLSLITRQTQSWNRAVKSRVTFRKITEEETTHYLATREPYDKAGAYAVQGLGAMYIERIEGSYTNVMGLPIEELLKGLDEVSGVSIYEWF
jgi:septum formation protein